MQGQNFQVNEIIQLAALALMIGSAAFVGKVFSPGYRSNGNPQKPEGQTELLKKFMEFNPELQRGMISYAERIRKGYQKKAGTVRNF